MSLKKYSSTGQLLQNMAIFNYLNAIWLRPSWHVSNSKLPLSHSDIVVCIQEARERVALLVSPVRRDNRA